METVELPTMCHTSSQLMSNPIDPGCIVAVTSINHQRDVATLYRLWETATAIIAMCIRNGQKGSWIGLGKQETYSTNAEVHSKLILDQGKGEILP